MVFSHYKHNVCALQTYHFKNGLTVLSGPK